MEQDLGSCQAEESLKYIMHTHIVCLDNRDFCNPLCQRTIKPNMKISLDDYAVSSNVGFCWALRLSQVLAFTECPIDSQAEESFK